MTILSDFMSSYSLFLTTELTREERHLLRGVVRFMIAIHLAQPTLIAIGWRAALGIPEAKKHSIACIDTWWDWICNRIECSLHNLSNVEKKEAGKKFPA